MKECADANVLRHITRHQKTLSRCSSDPLVALKFGLGVACSYCFQWDSALSRPYNTNLPEALQGNFIILPFGDENLSRFHRTHDCQSNSLTLPQKFRSVHSSCVPLSNTGQICRTPFSSRSLSPPGFRGTCTAIPHCSRSCPGRRGKLSFPSSVTGMARF